LTLSITLNSSRRADTRVTITHTAQLACKVARVGRRAVRKRVRGVGACPPIASAIDESTELGLNVVLTSEKVHERLSLNIRRETEWESGETQTKVYTE
jgi:hypothetical protein